MKVKVFLEALYDVPDDQDLKKLPDEIMEHGLGPEEAVAYTKVEVEVKEIKGCPECPCCGAVLTEILVIHEYSIEYGEESNQWVKHMGHTTYVCGNCTEELDIHDIEDVLKQVDEL